MIFRNPKARKTIALFLLVNMVNYIVYPTVSWALTSGPTAPEYSSFEPVDTTDMINLPTGDFTYSMPILNVPGASGGYPLSLSYHAGIQTNQDASWVGLGWTLNPGAINRSVNGFPDDYKDTNTSNRQFWEGGETTETTVTVDKMIGGGSAFYGMSFSNDTYRGVSNTSFYGYSKGPLGFTNSNGRTSVSIQGKIGLGLVGLTGGVTQNSDGEFTKSIGAYAGLNGTSATYTATFSDGGKTSSLGLDTPFANMDISTSSNRSSSVSIGSGGGSQSISNSKSGKISVNSSGFTTPKIPIFQTGMALRISHYYHRYWIDEYDSKLVNGSIYNRINLDMDNYASDQFELNDLDINQAYAGTTKAKASFLNYDSYTVTGQGIGGHIRPHNYQTVLSRQNVIEKKDNEPDKYLVKSLDIEGAPIPFNFRFVGDNSNQFTNNKGDWTLNGENLSFSYSDEHITGNNEADNNFGYNEATNNLAGSQYIDYYTNNDILAAQPGISSIIDCDAPGFNRSSNDQIGGYSITNTSGITYHYMLPVYTSDEQIFSGNIDQLDKYSFSYDKKDRKYAYTWLLTGITGPDYVDRGADGNPDGILNEYDWGYWVDFEHGKWTDSYRWRNPSEGSHKGLNRDSEYISTGIKELYYLNKIKTDTHTAIFVKDTRYDGKGVTSEKDSLVMTLNKEVTHIDEGGFSYQNKTYNSYNYTEIPISTQQLSSIYLLKNRDLPTDIRSLNETNQYEENWFDLESGPTIFNQLGGNIIDEGDLAELPSNFYEKVISGTKMNFDYSLADKTPNSFVSKLDALESSAIEDTATLLGKLSLQSVDFLYHGKSIVLPPVRFNYSYNPDYKLDAYDIWGFYKSNYVDQGNEDESRLTNPNESKAWSLDKITTSSGATINIEFEDDEYQSIYNEQSVNKIKNVNVIDEANEIVQLELFKTTAGMNINVGDELTINSLIRRKVSIPYYDLISAFREGYYWKILPSTVKITSIQSNSITVKEVFSGQSELAFWLSSSIDLFYNLESCENVPPDGSTYTQESTNPFYQAGFFTLDKEDVIGGGIRVNKITIATDSETQVTEYTYFDGQTTYEPKGIGIHIEPFEEDLNDPNSLADCIREKEFDKHKQFKKKYYEMVLGDFSNIINFVNEIPGPSVYYGSVEARSEVNGNQIPGYSKFTYYPFEKESIGLDASVNNNGIAIINDPAMPGNTTIEGRAIVDNSSYSTVIKNNSKSMGTNEYIETFDDQGNKLTQKYFEYTQSSDDFINNQGTIEEVFSEANHRYNPDEDNYDLDRFYSKRVTKSNFLTLVSSTNYKTGITQTTENLAFDFYSGQPTKVLTTDGYGNAYVTETTPAYQVTKADGSKAYESMGLKIHNSSNFHMLTQQGGSATYKVNPANSAIKLGLLSAGVQTWNDTWTYRNADGTTVTTGDDEKVWRKHKSYGWVGAGDLNTVNVEIDGTFKLSEYTSFDAWLPTDPVPDGWQINSETTLYDQFSHALEAKDLNGKYAATKMDAKNEYVFASVANANYEQFAFAGAEDAEEGVYYMGGGVTRPGTAAVSIETDMVHTGSKAIRVPHGGYQAFKYKILDSEAETGKIYKVSVWVDNATDGKLWSQNATAIGTPVIRQAGSWYLVSQNFELGSGDVQFGCESSGGPVIFDDFRVHPIDAAMLSYVYNQWGELSHTLDANNLFTKYVYDDAGRLIETHRESFQYGVKKINSTDYHYANQN